MWVVVCYAAGMEASAALVQDYLQEKIRGCTVQTALGNIASAEGLLARFEGADLVIPLLTESYVSSTGGRAQLTQVRCGLPQRVRDNHSEYTPRRTVSRAPARS